MALLKDFKRKTLREEWRVISILFAQLVVIVLIVVQVLQVLGLHADCYLKQVVFKFCANSRKFVLIRKSKGIMPVVKIIHNTGAVYERIW